MKRILLFLIPLSGMAVIIFAALRLVTAEHRAKPAGGGSNVLLLYCAATILPPVAGTGYEHAGGLVDLFQRRSGLRVEVKYGASHLLLGQLLLTRRGDLFLPGDDFYIQEARQAGLVQEVRTIARFVPVILVRRGNPRGIRGVADLANPAVRLAVADRHVTVIGRITPEIFLKNGVAFDELQNIHFTGTTAPEVAQAVARGHADAAIVWNPVARQYERDAEIIEIPPDGNVTSPLAIAVLTTSRNREAARQFVDFVAGPAGREHFARYHYDLEIE